ncbi:putative oxidoreductase [Phycisphaera mikurensis NBRC 102666]|uniref:Putative oxidoreductase n=1 Tax=Phycisphaera mikurensis (strain NBRC 102666 / KCTC 22515 / FYK2301M01) TaxID=1142394 RepID=I0ID57_PHYMF|nr:putative oxidoreductase [Phycisphaera mikurensis NBRC 102666]
MIRIGIIGAGPNARTHAHAHRDSGEAEVVAVADPAEGPGRALAEETGAHHVRGFEEMLDDVDAVVVSSPNFLHAEHAIAVAEAGKHLFCEKPLGLCLADARRIAAAVTDAGVASAVGFSPRLSREAQTLKHLLDSGRVGELISIWSRRLMFLPDDAFGGWRADPGRSGGLLLEVNVHEIDWMMHVAGAVSSVHAVTRTTLTHGPRANDHIWVTLSFKSGAVGQHEGSWRSATPNFSRGLHGTAGGGATDEWGRGVDAASLGQDREPAELRPAVDLRARWRAAIRGEGEPHCDVAWGLEVMRVAEAVFRSAEGNRVVRLDEPGLSG